MNKYVLDTSVVIEKIATDLIKKKKLKGTIIIPNAVVAELENQANKRQEIGFIGLEELQELQQQKAVAIEFVGDRPNETQIKFAKAGEIDAYIRDIARQEQATLITADFVQSESAKAYGLDVVYIKQDMAEEQPLTLEKMFDKNTMSLHLKEGCHAYGKKGAPGNWKLEQISKKKLTTEEVRDLAKEIVEKSRINAESFIEISGKGSTVIQYKDYRIVIVRPPVADGWEITVVRPIKKLHIKDYNVQEELLQRLKENASGILVVGETGSGKSTFVQALGDWYASLGFVTKTIESPRDLQVVDEVTQYSKNLASSEEIHDILFLSRPDYILFDEVRDTPDFKLYTDLKLGAGNVIGVVHAASPIEAVQRFIRRIDTGMIPSILDTIIFVEHGKINKILTLKITVKVPDGMTESDLARPIVEVSDFTTGKPEFEIYSYGEETVVIPVSGEQKSTGLQGLAAKEIGRVFNKYADEVDVEVVSSNKAIVYVPSENIARIIGQGGSNIEKLENQLGLSLTIKELEQERESIEFDVREDKKYVRLYADPHEDVEVHVDGSFLFAAKVSKKGEIKVNKQSDIGRALLKAMSKNKHIDLKA